MNIGGYTGEPFTPLSRKPMAIDLDLGIDNSRHELTENNEVYCEEKFGIGVDVLKKIYLHRCQGRRVEWNNTLKTTSPVSATPSKQQHI